MPNGITKYQSTYVQNFEFFQIVTNTKNFQVLIFLPKWWNFTKSGHTGPHYKDFFPFLGRLYCLIDFSMTFFWVVLSIFCGFSVPVTHRLWRKTRSSYDTSHNCIGVDADRNFDAHFDDVFEEAAENPCDDGYRGPMPFSEIEIQNVESFLASRTSNIKFASSLRSYGEAILLPSSYSNESKPKSEK